LNEQQMIEKMIKEKNNNNKNNDKNNGQNRDNNNKGNINDKDNGNEYKSEIFNSTIFEVIQGIILFKKEQNENLNERENDLKEKDQKPKKLSYEQKEMNKFSNIYYDFDETNKNINNVKNKDNKDNKDNIIANNNNKNKKDKKETEDKFCKISKKN